MNTRANEKLNENFDNLYPSKYFKLTDVDGDIVLTIANCEETAFRDGTKKAVLSFDEDARGLPLNKSNYTYLRQNLGDVGNWPEQQIVLSPINSPFGAGKMLSVRKYESPRRPAAVHAEALELEEAPF